MIDLISDLGPVLAERIVGQLRQVHYGVKALKVLDRHMTQILDDGPRHHAELLQIAVEPAIAVEAGIQAYHFMAAAHQQWRQAGAD